MSDPVQGLNAIPVKDASTAVIDGGTISVITTFTASLGPLLAYTRVYMIWSPAMIMAGPFLTMAISAEVFKVVTMAEVLFTGFGSGVSLVTTAAFAIFVVTLLRTKALISILYIAPKFRVPIFNDPVQAIQVVPPLMEYTGLER